MNADRPLSKFDIVGPTVDDEIRRLLQRYGAEKVQKAIKRQTARSRGRPHEKDWQEMVNILREDARIWLENGNPFQARSNRKIAQDFLSRHPGHSDEAVLRRIMGKLSKRRRYYTIVEAEWLSQTEYPYRENLRAIGELIKIGIWRDQWERLLHFNESSLVDYRDKFGEPPASMPMQKLHEEAARAILPNALSESGNVLQILLGHR